eukprot:scaffold5_cov104-Skeletonema_dohrnii-CCMP3373.AAC.8
MRALALNHNIHQTENSSQSSIMRSKPKHPYEKISSEEEAATQTTPFKMIGSITLGSLALAAITWSSYSLISADHNPPTLTGRNPTLSTDRNPLSSSNFVEISAINITSSYEQRWSGAKLPKWATKKINFSIPKEQEICFAHVGKAGGSTLGCSLGFSLHCHDDGVGVGVDDASVQIENHTSSSLLAKLTTHIFHKDVYNCDDDAGYILFIVRDPVARALSAFNYDKPDENDFLHSPDWAKRKAHFYSDCPFPHMEDFVQNGLREEGDAPDRCKRLAIESLQGIDSHKDQSPGHWYLNYQYYLEAIPSDSKIFTIRNEHIEEDIRSIENFFECNEQERLALTKSVNTNTWSDQDDLYLSDESISILCRALCNEIQFYKKILHRAINMSQDQLRVSLSELEAKCPHEAIAEECLDVIPDIGEKLRDNRGY